MVKIKFRPPNYPTDLVHIDRWMCSKCGLIFDFSSEHSPDEPGWISYDPPLEHANVWIDDEGDYQFEEVEHREICSRCGCDLSEYPLQRIFVSATITLDDIKPIIQQGEGDSIEFMVKFPDNAHELAKEIAAFSTSKGGKIFLGIEDTGVIVGLHDIQTPEEIDNLIKRIRGVAGKVIPKADISVDFISTNNIRVAIITVRKGVMPLYECEGRVYIRDLDASRPATYDEKIRLNSDWLEKRSKAG